MKKTTIGLVSAMSVALMGATAFAGPDDDTLVINDELEMVTETAAPEHLDAIDTIYSGWRFRTDETQALQLDDFENPAMIFVDQAMDAFNTVDGSEGKSC
ncbi:MAG: sulfur oxidation c-type cytochrome SoxA, partial [Silicimonas sp.]|nr:sulfur oxidation c-type cytochrome SoxA [Silicimonas sp.]